MMQYEGIVIITTCLKFDNISIDSTISIIIIILLLTFIGKFNKYFRHLVSKNKYSDTLLIHKVGNAYYNTKYINYVRCII